MIPDDLLEKIAVGIMSGFSKDAIKNGFVVMNETIKNQLKKYLLTEEERQALTQVLNKIPAEIITSEENIIQYLKTQLHLTPIVNQTHYGSGDNLVGIKIVR